MSTDIARVRTVISGWTGGPGLSTFYFAHGPAGGPFSSTDCAGLVARVHAYFDATKGLYRGDAKINVSGAVDILNDSNGDLISAFAVTDGAQILATNANSFESPAVAGLASLHTAGIIHNHRLMGRTYISPLCNDSLNSGDFKEASRVSVATALEAMAGIGGSIPGVVWSRPFTAPAGSTIPSRTGSSYPITGVTVATKMAILRSRRD